MFQEFLTRFIAAYYFKSTFLAFIQGMLFSTVVGIRTYMPAHISSFKHPCYTENARSFSALESSVKHGDNRKHSQLIFFLEVASNFNSSMLHNHILRRSRSRKASIFSHIHTRHDINVWEYSHSNDINVWKYHCHQHSLIYIFSYLALLTWHVIGDTATLLI